MKAGQYEVTRPKSAGKVFFFARSPEAPRTTMTVSSLSSMVLVMIVLAIDRATRDLLRRKAARLSIVNKKRLRLAYPGVSGS